MAAVPVRLSKREEEQEEKRGCTDPRRLDDSGSSAAKGTAHESGGQDSMLA